jgi:hypothetical protein
VEAGFDETGVWRSEDSATPDTECRNAVVAAMATIKSAQLLAVGTPFAKRGEQFRTHQKYWGQNDPRVLVWWARGSELAFNPTVATRVIEDAFDRDPVAARSEWGSEYRDDISTYIDIDTVQRRVVPHRVELPPTQGIPYRAACDAAGGAGKDSFTACIAHRSGDTIVIDAVREIKPPFSPDVAVEQIVAVLRAYGVSRITGDRFGGEWVAERFRRHGVSYQTAEYTRSEAYLSALPMLTAERVQLLDHPKLIAQFAQLERRTSAQGRDTVDHPRGSHFHDDLANSVALAIATLARPPRGGGPPSLVMGI